MIAQHSSVQSHDIARWAFLSTVVTALVSMLQLRDLILQDGIHATNPVLIVRLVNFAFTVALAFANISLPRRPDVFFRNEKVDKQFTVSILNRYTWTWGYWLLSLAIKKGDLDEKDIPQPDSLLRAETLLQKWHDEKYTSTLAWSVFREYRGRLFLQWTVIAIRCLFGIGPFYIMEHLIATLDYKMPDQWPTAEMWGYVFWMGFFSLAEMVSLAMPTKPWHMLITCSGWTDGSLSNRLL